MVEICPCCGRGEVPEHRVCPKCHVAIPKRHALELPGRPVRPWTPKRRPDQSELRPFADYVVTKQDKE